MRSLPITLFFCCGAKGNAWWEKSRNKRLEQWRMSMSKIKLKKDVRIDQRRRRTTQLTQHRILMYKRKENLSVENILEQLKNQPCRGLCCSVTDREDNGRILNASHLEPHEWIRVPPVQRRAFQTQKGGVLSCMWHYMQMISWWNISLLFLLLLGIFLLVFSL